MRILAALLLHLSLLHAVCVKAPCNGVEQPFDIELRQLIEKEYAKLNQALDSLEQEYQRYLQVLQVHQEKLKKLKQLYKEQNLDTKEILFFQKQFNHILSNQIERRMHEETMDSPTLQ